MRLVSERTVSILLILLRSVESPSKAASPVSAADATSNDSNATSSSMSLDYKKGRTLDIDFGIEF